MGEYFVIDLPNCIKWKATASCTALKFGGAPTMTYVAMLPTDNTSNTMPTFL